MNKKTKILFFGSYPTLPIGYSRISNKITNYLADKKEIELYYFGISNFQEINKVNRYIHPNIKLIDALELSKEKGSADLFGIDNIVEVIEDINPQIFIIYNDCIVVCRIFNELLKLKNRENIHIITYLDLVYTYEKKRYIDFIDKNSDRILVFSSCWKKNIIEMGVNKENVGILEHGIDKNTFYHIQPEKYIKKRFNFNENDFVILNTNRNQYRKAHDISIRAFILLLKKCELNKNIKMFINTDYDGAYTLLEVIETECMRYNVSYEEVINNHILTFPTKEISDEHMNELYNACDVGINSCLGEGFGLCNAEHASLNKVQVVTNIGGLSDIFLGYSEMLVDPVAFFTITNTQDQHNGDAYVCRAEDFAEKLYYFYKNPEERKKLGNKIGKHIREKYDWEKILDIFYKENISIFT